MATTAKMSDTAAPTTITKKIVKVKKAGRYALHSSTKIIVLKNTRKVLKYYSIIEVNLNS